MASLFGHVLASAAITHSIAAQETLSKRLWALSLLSGIFPDIDVIAFKLGIPYRHIFGHRGLTHSIGFAFLWATVLTFSSFKSSRLRIFVLLLISTLSHGILDAMTNGGLGVGFFIPFDDHRFFLQFRPIEVSPIKLERFFSQTFQIIANEMIWIGIPSLILVFMSYLWKKDGNSFR